MRRMNNKSGFTLLEILVVIIIVGVLASVAMPTLFRNVERSRSVEALNSFGILKRGLDACSMQFNGDFTTCNTWVAAGMQNPTAAPGSHFTYAEVASGADPTNSWSVVATRNAFENGDGASTITLTYNAGTVTRTGTGAFAGLQ